MAPLAKSADSIPDVTAVDVDQGLRVLRGGRMADLARRPARNGSTRRWLDDRHRVHRRGSDWTCRGGRSTAGSQVGSHRQPTQYDSEPTEAFDNRHWPGIKLLRSTLGDRRGLVRIEGVTDCLATWRDGSFSRRRRFDIKGLPPPRDPLGKVRCRSVVARLTVLQIKS